jgi:hypothetical protein
VGKPQPYSKRSQPAFPQDEIQFLSQRGIPATKVVSLFSAHSEIDIWQTVHPTPQNARRTATLAGKEFPFTGKDHPNFCSVKTHLYGVVWIPC